MKISAAIVLLATLISAARAQTAPAPPPAQPPKILLRIHQTTIITPGFLGFGVELDPMALNANNRRRGVTDEDWKLLTQRLAAMKMPIVRMMTQLSWFYKIQNAPFDYENPQAKSVLAYLDFCQAQGIDVILTDWSWSNECKWLHGRDDPAFAKGVATYLHYLLDEKKYSCIKFLVVGNEPDNEIKDVDVYSRMVHNIDAALKTAGLRNKLKLMGPDTADRGEWFDLAGAKIADVVDAYDFHRYPDQADVRDDGQKKLTAILGRYRPAADKFDPNGKNKPILMTEMGMGGGAMSGHKLIDTPDYALHMGDYAIGVLNSGAKAGIAWCAFDVYYYEGDLLMKFGMWKYKDENWQLKPWHAVWQQVTSSVPRGGDVLAVTGGTGTVHAAAVASMRPAGASPPSPPYGKIALLLANRSSDPQALSIERPNPAPGRWSQTCYTKDGLQKTDPADLAPANAPLDLSLPADSFTVLSMDFPPR